MIGYDKNAAKITNEDFVEKAIQLYKLYCELYNDDLVGVSSVSVHLEEERYFTLFSMEESIVRLCGENIEYSFTQNGVRFITLKKLTIDMIKHKI
jgi:hypothetical protein